MHNVMVFWLKNIEENMFELTVIAFFRYIMFVLFKSKITNTTSDRRTEKNTLAPLGGFFEGKNKMAVRHFKVKYGFSTNKSRNKCNTQFPCDFDWEIHLLYYFYDSNCMT